MNSCKECKAECCQYVSVSLNPKYPEDWDEIKWFLLHENVIVYKDHENEWMVEFRTKCRHLDETNHKCTKYEHRPQICKEHDPHDCDASPGEFYTVLFKKPEDVDEYLKKLNNN